MANTYGTMQSRIAGELDRDTTTTDISGITFGTHIQNAIQDAIGLHERKYYYFINSPTSFSFTTVAGQEYYTSTDNAAIATVNRVVQLVGTFFGLRRPLNKVSWDYIASISTLTTSRAMPQDWAYFGEQIRLYPIPDNAYSIAAAAVARPARPSANSDQGVWMNDAEAVIRTQAKLYLLKNVIRASDMAEEVLLLKDQLREEVAALFEETASREARGHVEPVRF